ncbi:MAG: PEGA domain-containing protein [bacterium]
MSPIRIALVSVLALIVGSPSAQARKGAPERGYLKITSKPMAQVYVDGRVIGTTPIKRLRAEAGRRQVELRTSDGRTLTRFVVIRAGQTIEIKHVFPAARPGGTGWLTITSSPWSQVFVSGRAVGNTPLTRYGLTARSYDVELNCTTTGQTYKRRVYVLRGKTTMIHHVFPKTATAKSAPVGWIWIRSQPEAKVFVNGRARGKTPLRDLEVKAGKLELELRTEDGRVHRRTIWLPEDKTAKLSHVFKPKPAVAQKARVGWLYITSSVEARVNVDGHNVGRTPIKRLAVNPGRHRLILRSDGGKRRTVYIHTAAGLSRQVHVRF